MNGIQSPSRATSFLSLAKAAAKTDSPSIGPTTGATTSRISLPKAITSSISNAIKTIGNAISNGLKSMNEKVELPTLATGLVIGTVKGYSELAVPTLEAMKHGIEAASPILEKAVVGMGVGLGAIAIYNGCKELGKAYTCHIRSEGLKSASPKLDSLMTDKTASSKEIALIQQLKSDLSSCQKTNEIKSHDLALSGAIDIAVGSSSLALAVASHGATALVTPLVTWGTGAVIKTAVAMVRGSQASPTAAADREAITHRLNHGVKALQDKISTGIANNAPVTFSPADKAMLVALQSVGLIDKGADIHAAPSSKVIDQLKAVTHESIEERFTSATNTINIKQDPVSTNLLKGAMIFAG